MYELSKISRSILYDAKMPESMWCYAIEYSARLKNRRPTKALPFKQIKGHTPAEAWTGRKEDLSKYRVFGAVAWPVEPKERHPRKMESRTRKGRFILVGMTFNDIQN